MEDVMDALWESDLRLYLAAPLLAIGLVLLIAGSRRAYRAFRLPFRVRDKNLRLMSGFRSTLVGSALLAGAAGWLWNVPALFAGAVIIGVGELLETSLDVWALRRGAEGR
jgi:hypothetical protein